MIDAEYDDAGEAESELDLAASDSLPWLESDEDEAVGGGLDAAQIFGFAAILAVPLIGIVGAIWYFSNHSGNTEVVADGSTIVAPAGPIKEKPADPGGKQFAGTGNVAPVVAEGGTREAMIATDDSNAPPVSPPPTRPTAAPSPTVSTVPAAAVPSGVGVQLAAYSSRARAEQGWSELVRRTDALSGVRYRVVEGRVDIGTVYRLQAVTADRAAADQLCAALKADGLDCQVKP